MNQFVDYLEISFLRFCFLYSIKKDSLIIHTDVS